MELPMLRPLNADLLIISSAPFPCKLRPLLQNKVRNMDKAAARLKEFEQSLARLNQSVEYDTGKVGGAYESGRSLDFDKQQSN